MSQKTDEQRALEDAAVRIWDDLPSVVIENVFLERARQDAQWGGPEHDDTHKPADWLTYIDQQISKAHQLLRDAPDATLDTDQHDAALRERLVKVAALALAGLASFERKAPQACRCPACQLEDLLRGVGVDARVHVLSPTPGLDMLEALMMASFGRASGKGGKVH